MKRGIVYKIRDRQDVAQILNSYSTDPTVIDDVLLIINLEEAEAQIAGVKCQRRNRQQQEGDQIRMPRSGQERLRRVGDF